MDIVDYPHYDSLSEVDLDLIRSNGELYAVRLCRDKEMVCTEDCGWLPCRYYTVEIISNVIGPKTINYKNKLMLAVNIRPTFLPKRVLYAYIITLYINTLDEARLSRLAHEEIER